MNHINKYIKTISIASLGFLLMCSGAFAQGVTSNIAGYITLNIKGNNGADKPAYSFLSIPLIQTASDNGVVDAINGTTISKLDADWAEDEFNDNMYYIEITSGENIGVTSTIIDTTATSIVTNDDLSSLINVDDSFVIRKYTTIADVFGANNEAGLQGGGTLGAADRILLYDAGSQKFDRYYYKNDGLGANSWRSSSGEKSNAILYPGSALIVESIRPDDLDVIVTGIVQPNDAVTPVESGYNFVASHFPTDVTLNQMFGSDGGKLIGGGTASQADSILVPNGNGGYDSYYFKNSGLGIEPGDGQWRSTSASGDQGDSVIAEAGGVIIINRSQEEAFNLPESVTYE